MDGLWGVASRSLDLEESQGGGEVPSDPCHKRLHKPNPPTSILGKLARITR